MANQLIPRPDITVAQIILLMLSQKGAMGFQDILLHPSTKALGTQRTENSFYTALARLKRRKYIVRTVDRTYVKLLRVGFVGDTQTRAINRYRNRTLDREHGEMVGISFLTALDSDRP